MIFEMTEDSASLQQEQESSETSFFNVKPFDSDELEPHSCSATIGLGWDVL